MTAYRGGDVDAFAALMRRHERPLWNFLRRFVGDRAVAEDLLQEVFLRVVKNAAEWEPTAKVSTWLYTIARNLCTDHARRQVFRKAASLDAPGRDEGSGPKPLVERLPREGGDGERGAMTRELAARIEAAVAALPEDQREVFLMREQMDMPFADIARAVGASEPTVKSRMRYALERLRAALAEYRDQAGAAGAKDRDPTP